MIKKPSPTELEKRIFALQTEINDALAHKKLPSIRAMQTLNRLQTSLKLRPAWEDLKSIY